MPLIDIFYLSVASLKKGWDALEHFVITDSFCCRIDTQYLTFQIYKYKKKAKLISVIITLSNLQLFLIDSLATHNVIPCGGHLISPRAMGSIIKSILTMVETLSLGSYMFKIYMDELIAFKGTGP